MSKLLEETFADAERRYALRHRVVALSEPSLKVEAPNPWQDAREAIPISDPLSFGSPDARYPMTGPLRRFVAPGGVLESPLGTWVGIEQHENAVAAAQERIRLELLAEAERIQADYRSECGLSSTPSVSAPRSPHAEALRAFARRLEGA